MQDKNDKYVMFGPNGDMHGPNSLCDYLNRLENENAVLLRVYSAAQVTHHKNPTLGAALTDARQIIQTIALRPQPRGQEDE